MVFSFVYVSIGFVLGFCVRIGRLTEPHLRDPVRKIPAGNFQSWQLAIISENNTTSCDVYAHHCAEFVQ
jgi:hypothetical protein